MPNGDGRRGIAEVVDQVGEEGNAAGRDVDRELRDGRSAEHGEGEADRPDTLSRSLDGFVDEPVGAAVLAVVVAVAIAAAFLAR